MHDTRDPNANEMFDTTRAREREKEIVSNNGSLSFLYAPVRRSILIESTSKTFEVRELLIESSSVDRV